MNDYEDPIAEFIEASAEGLCTGYVVIANIERINGDQSFWVTTLRNQKMQYVSLMFHFLQDDRTHQQKAIAHI